MNKETPRSAIAFFHKDSRGRLTMHSLIAVGGERYPNTVTYYDVDFSRDRGCHIYHMSGAGGRAPIEVSGIYAFSGVPVEVVERPCNLVKEASRKRNGTRRLLSAPTSFELKEGWDYLDWLEHNGIHGDAVWCATCRDYMHEESLCRHTWWCNKTGAYSTPDDRCACADREECRD